MVEPIQIDYAPVPKTKRHSVLTMLATSFVMAFAIAITFVVVMTLTLPRSDGAHGQMPFQDPLVFPVMSMGASVAALVVFPFFYFSCRTLPLRKSVLIVLGITLAGVVIVTPFSAFLGFVGSFIAFACGLAAARSICRAAQSRVNDI
jgi:hypothetical protein